MKVGEYSSKAEAKKKADETRKTHLSVLVYANQKSGLYEVRAGKRK